jgi:hypothetical protein
MNLIHTAILVAYRSIMTGWDSVYAAASAAIDSGPTAESADIHKPSKVSSVPFTHSSSQIHFLQLKKINVSSEDQPRQGRCL